MDARGTRMEQLASWWIGGALVADGVDADAPFIAQPFQHMGKLALALKGLPIGGYFLGPRALHIRFPVGVPLQVRRACVFPVSVANSGSESAAHLLAPGCALGLFGFPFR